MMVKNELENPLNLVEDVKLVQEQISKLKIDWETDLDQMNFSDLRSHGFLNFDIKDKYQRIRLNTIDISNEFMYFTKETFDLYFQDDVTHDLIDFISKQNKIIPPLYEIPLEYCGETFKPRQLYPIHRLDGTHRVLVSYFSGLKKIPIVVAERVKRFSFPIDKWDFERTDESFTAKSKDGNNIIEIDSRRMRIDDSISNKNTLVVMTGTPNRE